MEEGEGKGKRRGGGREGEEGEEERWWKGFQASGALRFGQEVGRRRKENPRR